MKYLKTYEHNILPNDQESNRIGYPRDFVKPYHIINESEDTIGDDLKDICLELQDEGFHIAYQWEESEPKSNRPFYTINIYQEKFHEFVKFKISNCLDVLLRIKDFAEISGYHIKIYSLISWHSHSPKENTTDITDLITKNRLWRKFKNAEYSFRIRIKLGRKDILGFFESSNKPLINYSTIPIDMENEINDILLELKDIGYHGCRVISNKYAYIARRAQRLSSGPDWCKYMSKCDEVKEVIDRIQDYAEQCGYDSSVESGRNTCRIFFTKNDSITEQNQYPVKLPDNILSEVKDIFLELTDQGFKIVNTGVDFTFFEINKPTSSNNFIPYKKIRLWDISEVIERIKDYVFDEGYDVIVRKNKVQNHVPNVKIFFSKI